VSFQGSPRGKHVTYAAKVAKALAHGLGHFSNHRLRARSQRNSGEHARSVRKALGSFVLRVSGPGKLGLRGRVVHTVGGLLLKPIQCSRGVGDGTSRGQYELLGQIVRDELRLESLAEMQLGSLQNLRSIAQLLSQHRIVRMVDQVLRVA
jgi:hypothetical protein